MIIRRVNKKKVSERNLVTSEERIEPSIPNKIPSSNHMITYFSFKLLPDFSFFDFPVAAGRVFAQVTSSSVNLHPDFVRRSDRS